MSHKAWVPMRCSRTGQHLMAQFGRVEQGWSLSVVQPTGASTTAPSVSLSGAFPLDEEYGGCPACRAMSFVQCRSCGALGCWDRAEAIFSCATCGQSGPVSGRTDQIRAADTGVLKVYARTSSGTSCYR